MSALSIPHDLAYAAHRGTSFVPDQRAQQEQESFAATLRQNYAALAKYATTPEKQAILDAQWPRFAAGYHKRYLAYLASRSRCMSAMITGPAKFPVARNEKRWNSADNKRDHLCEFERRAMAAIARMLTPERRPIMAGDDDAASRLREKIVKAERLQALMKAANLAIRKNRKAGREAQIAGLIAAGIPEKRAAELLEPDFCGRIGFPDYMLTNNNANIKRMKGRLVAVERNHAAPTIERESESGIRLEDCPAENRVRLFFPGKPAADVRSRLKSCGFRWSPTLGCWQAYRNPRSLEVAGDMAK